MPARCRDGKMDAINHGGYYYKTMTWNIRKLDYVFLKFDFFKLTNNKSILPGIFLDFEREMYWISKSMLDIAMFDWRDWRIV